ncbi:hypothetical protein D8674_007949 [Pyrus ussuriensis x Pyrus communis]|uniref:DCD domain-containing protein n=1 Tax=Pyrus ussuriensis x Pyrus communis TaxID=2448454 RepID=A0A5N5HYB1_9ROSA|nr:hypothetical protein D8674_007949 [Pyrus ussuriensis x Pyrus communis]
MGAGRKTQTFTLSSSQDMAPYSASMRNLRRNSLGGVIFGATRFTIDECLSKQLFGLPAAHYMYVKNITPGLPLFLFNYSDRKLHGIFEATGLGQMNINPYGWSTDGSERTQYPAQVKFHTRMQCRPLLESEYKDIIADNYYTESHFWFELDHSQTSKLTSKFASVKVAPSNPVPQIPKSSSVNVAPSTSVPQGTLNWRKACFPAPPSHDTKEQPPASLSHDTKEKCPAFTSHDTIEEPEWLEPLTSETEHLSDSCPNWDAPILFGRYNALNSQYDVKEAEQVEQEWVYGKLKELALQYDLNGECQDMSFSGNVDDSAVSNEMTWEDTEESMAPLGLDEKRPESSRSSFEQKSRESSRSLSENPIITKLIEEVEELKASKKEQSVKIGLLEHKLKKAELEIQQLKVWTHEWHDSRLLINFWMVNGILESHDHGNLELEDIVAQDECFAVDFEGTTEISENISINESFLQTCFSRFRYLRMLVLFDSTCEAYPSSIVSLKHMRHLQLSGNARISKLPDAVCKLQSLEILTVSRCVNLEELPRDISKLISLRWLEITTKQTSFPDNGVGCMKSLRYLSIRDCDNLTSLPRDMSYLGALHTLIIGNCEQLDLANGNYQLIPLRLRSLLIGGVPRMVALPEWLQGAANTLRVC